MTIDSLCREHTNLSEAEIDEIKCAARSLSAMANLFNADAFIDCPMNDGTGDAIVVAEAKPVDGNSLYKRPVVGLVATKEKEPAVYRGFHIGVPTKFMKAMTQENVHVVQTVEPIYYKDRVIGVFIIEQKMEQITEEIGSRTDSWESNQDHLDDVFLYDRNQNLIDTIEEGLIFVNHQNKVIFRNKFAEAIYKRLGFINDILGSDYKDICIVKPPNEDSEKYIMKQDVKLGNYYFTVKTVRVNRNDLNYVVTISDITTNKLQEKELVLKSVAFHEMHHRVKNNLQTIAALLRLQKGQIESEEGQRALTDTVARILAIAATHQIMVETGVEEVQLNDIIAIVKDNTLAYYTNDDFNLHVDCYGGDFAVTSEKATAIALILNELTQNSIKYAFGGRKEGKITFMTMQRRAQDIELVFMDNGCGFDVEKTSSGGMGWTIIRSMVKEKLGGHLTVKSGDFGVKVKMVFSAD